MINTNDGQLDSLQVKRDTAGFSFVWVLLAIQSAISRWPVRL